MSFGEYVSAGWHLCRIEPGTKAPKTPGWSKKGGSIVDSAVAQSLVSAGLCHAWSGTCSIDIDNYPVALEWFAARGIDLDALLAHPQSVQIISGKVNRAKLLYRISKPLPSLQLAPYTDISPKTGKPTTFHGFELRCATKSGDSVQDVLPPSIHPETGKPYAWAYGDEMFGHWSNLPELPSAILALWEAEMVCLPTDGEATKAAAKGVESSALRELVLGTPNNGCTYDDWLKMGMRINVETKGSEEGFELWREWSAQSDKHDISHMRVKWRSFDPNETNGVTLGGLLREQVAAPVEFPELNDIDIGSDTRSDVKIKALLEDRLVFIKRQALYYDLQDSSDTFLTDRAIQHIFCPHMPAVIVPGKKGKEDKVTVPDPVEWLKRSKTKKVADQIGVHPGEGRLYREDATYFANRYEPLVVEPLIPTAHEKEAFAFMWSRMEDVTMQQWLMKFYAHTLQKPGLKIQSAPLLYSQETGTCKNTIARVIPELLFGARWVKSMSGDVLGGQFSDVLGETWWLYLEELRAGSTKIERVAVANKIKTWVTDPRMTVHPKGLKPYDARNRLQITATSNFADAIHIDNNDRRWAIISMLGSLSEREALDLYGGFLHTDRAPGVLRHIFQNVSTTGFNPAARAPMSTAKKAMITAGVGTWESKLIERICALEPPFDRDLFRLKDVLEQVTGMQNMSAQVLSSMLKSDPFKCETIKGRNGVLWCWRNAKLWAACTEPLRDQHYASGGRTQNIAWDMRIPPHILEMSADGSVDSGQDLL